MCKQQISQIEQEIFEIDSSNHITIDMNRKPDLENKLNSLFKIKKKVQGAQIRSRAKWVSGDGKKILNILLV